jgi:hypothetical protein
MATVITKLDRCLKRICFGKYAYKALSKMLEETWPQVEQYVSDIMHGTNSVGLDAEAWYDILLWGDRLETSRNARTCTELGLELLQSGVDIHNTEEQVRRFFQQRSEDWLWIRTVDPLDNFHLAIGVAYSSHELERIAYELLVGLDTEHQKCQTK